MNDVRELLREAAAEAGEPRPGGGAAVFARASRLRWRRRAAVTGVVAAAVAGGLVLGPTVLGADRPESGVASAPNTVGPGAKSSEFEKLLPAGTGTVRETSLPIVKVGSGISWLRPVGPYDADYTVSRDGGIGYITVRTSPAKEARYRSLCKDTHKYADRTHCTTENLPDGGVLSILWAADKAGSPPKWGEEFIAVLWLRDGRQVQIRDGAGIPVDKTGLGGPLLKSPPLTKSQLRELALRPELLP